MENYFDEPPFVFADWLAEMGWEKDFTGWENQRIGVWIIINETISVYRFGVTDCVFQDANIPTNRNEAEIIFKAFNLL